MIKKIIFLSFIVFFINLNLKAQEKYKLYWNFKLNQNFTIDMYTKQTIIKNGVTLPNRLLREYVILIPYLQTNNRTLLKGEYYSYYNDMDNNSPYYLDNIYQLDFAMDKAGKYYVKPALLMPSMRDIPLFPDTEVTIGQTWTIRLLKYVILTLLLLYLW